MAGQSVSYKAIKIRVKKGSSLHVVYTENNIQRMYANLSYKACEMENPEGFGLLSMSQAMSGQTHGVILVRIKLIALAENRMMNPKSSLA